MIMVILLLGKRERERERERERGEGGRERERETTSMAMTKSLPDNIKSPDIVRAFDSQRHIQEVLKDYLSEWGEPASA